MHAGGEGTRSSLDSEPPPSSRSDRQVELLLALGRATAEARDLDSLVAEAVELALATLEADVVLLHEARGETLVLLGSATRGVALDPEMRATLARLSLADETLAGQCARSRSLVCASVEGWPSWCRSMASELGVRSGAAVPLLAGEHLVGTLVALRTALRPMTRHELRLLETSAAQLGAAIEHLRLLDEERKHAAELAAVHEMGRLIVEELELGRVLEVAVRHLSRVAGGVNVFIMLLEANVLRMGATNVPEPYGPSLVLPMDGTSVATTSIAERSAILVRDVESDPRVALALAQRLGHRSILAVPLFARDEPVGTVVLGLTREGASFSERDVTSVEAVANQLALAVANARLIEDLRGSYAELANAQRTLVERERLAALGELSAVIAHEVRNPLAIIWNSLGTLRHKLRPTGEVAALLEIVREESDQLNRMVTDLLDYARPNLVELRRAELRPLIVEVVEAARVTVAVTSVEVVVEVPDAMPHVLADARLLRQALLNLVSNALQAMPNGGLITVTATADLAAHRASIEVADEGEGLSPEARARLFEPFFTTKATGTGLGLALVKRIVDAHDGEIRVASGAERGTIFTLRLPLAGASTAPPPSG